MNSVEMDSDNKDEFKWRFQALNRNEINKSYLIVEKDGQTFKTYTEMFKGYPREVSARLSMLLGSNGGLTPMGEFAFNYWFEDVFGWTQYYLARQRWGISLKYFLTATKLKFSTSEAQLQSTTIDLKYRITPGLWNRDETWGIIFGSRDLSYDYFAAQMVGVGAFWARSMPRVFDDIMNLFPFMGYPKWVDMEFIYYPVNFTSKVTANNWGMGNGNWALNFHGKLMWTKQFFGEAGFGMKQIDFTMGSPLDKRLNFTSLYGTAGLGWSF
jgi:hypothetical protein